MKEESTIPGTRSYLVRAVLAGVMVLGSLAASASAQDTGGSDSRWQGWLGCWRPEEATGASLPQLCIIPAPTSSAVDLVTFVESKEVSRTRLDASGERRAVKVDGCDGWETTRWSSDNRRAYSRSEVTCSDGLQRIATSVLALSRFGDLLDVRSVRSGDGTGTRVNRFRDASVQAELPAEIVSALSGRAMVVSDARTVAGAPLTMTAIVEASRFLDAAALEAFLVERGEKFRLNAKELIALADAGVPGSVTDVMIGLSNPQVFALNRKTGSGGGGTTTSRPTSSRSRCSALNWSYDPWAFTPYWGYGMYDRGGCGYGRYGYGYNPYGYDRFGYNGFYSSPTYVVVERVPPQKAQAVKGKGYTQPGRSSTASSSGSSGSSSSGSTGTSSSGSSGTSSSGSSGSGRTAKARP